MVMLFTVYFFALAITLFAFLILASAVRTALDRSSVHMPAESATGLGRLRRKIRILMFGWEFPPFNSGGLGVATLGIAKGLSDLGTDLTLVFPKALPTVSFARVRNANLPQVDMNAVNGLLSPYLDSGSYARLANGKPVYGSDLVSEVRRYGEEAAKFAAAEPYDVIYAHDWLSFPAGISAKRVTGKPLVAHVHATEFDRTGGSAIDQRIYDIERAGVHAADRVIAVSGRTKDTLVSRYGVPHQKVTVVHNGIDETTAPAGGVARLLRVKRLGYNVVLFLGRLTLQKGPDYFLRAAEKVLRAHPRTVFLIAGAGDMERQIIEQAAELGIAKHVFFTGFLRGKEQAEAYAAADLFVMPSVSEPFGITALEALHAGVPVIISRQSGVAEAVPEAVQVDFWDIELLAKEISALLADPARRRALANAGKKSLHSLTWAHTARGIRAVTDGLVTR
jgi:glycosyltransferase involved in cell wall biosynthesis